MPQQFQYSSIFGELTKNVQIRFDAASELNKQLFDQVIFEKYLKWDTPTIGLDFEEIIGNTTSPSQRRLLEISLRKPS